MLRMYHDLFNHLPLVGYLIFFPPQFWAITNKTAMNNYVLAFMLTCFHFSGVNAQEYHCWIIYYKCVYLVF